MIIDDRSFPMDPSKPPKNSYFGIGSQKNSN